MARPGGHLRAVVSHGEPCSPEVFDQHNIGFGEFTLNIQNGFAVRRHGQSPTGFFVQGPERDSFAGRKIEELN